MPPQQPHFVGRLDVTVSVANLDVAMDMRPRVEALAWERLPGILERVLDRLDVPGMCLHVGRLDLDLGTLDPGDLEAGLPTAFEQALSEALTEALHGARHGIAGEVRLVPEPAMLLERFESYLRSGVTPFAGEGGDLFDPPTLVDRLLRDQPLPLVAALRRAARDRSAIERLALQAGEAGLRRLLDVLQPADAGLVLALMLELRLAHRLEPARSAVRIAEPALERLLWVTTIEFLLRDAGSQFNRRRFLGFLLRREAERAGVGYADLLQLLDKALTQARTRAGPGTTLPAALADLLAEGVTEAVAEIDATPAPASGEAALAAARDGDFDGLLAVARRRLGNRAGLDALVRKLPRIVFVGLIRRIEPANAELIVGLLDDLNATREPNSAPGYVPDAFSWRMQSLTLRYLLRDAGSQFNRRRFLGSLLREEAAHTGMAYAALLHRLWETVRHEQARTRLRSSLPAVLSDLLSELRPIFASEGEPEPAPDSARPDAAAAARAGDFEPLLGLLRSGPEDDITIEEVTRALDPRTYMELIERLRPGHGAAMTREIDGLIALHAVSAVAALSADGFAVLVRAIGLRLLLHDTGAGFSRAAWLRAVLDALAEATETRPQALRAALAEAAAASAHDRQGSLADHLSRALAEEDEAAVLWLTEAAGDPLSLVRQAAALDARDRMRALGLLAPAWVTAVHDDLHALARLHVSRALIPIDGTSFECVIWALAVRYLAGLRGARFDRVTLGRVVLQGLARYGGVSPPELAARLRRSLGSAGAGGAPARAMAEAFAREHLPPKPEEVDRSHVLAQFLRSGHPAAAGRALVMLAAEAPGDLAGLIRRLAREAPGTVPRMIARLLEWLLPEELLDCLAPALRSRALRWADDVGTAGLEDWRALFTAVLRGETVSFAAASDGFGKRLDTIALAAHWLDHGVVAEWAPGGTSETSLARGLIDLAHADLVWLFATGDRARTADRIRRAMGPLDGAAGARLIERLAPWAARGDGVLASAIKPLDPAGRTNVLQQAAAAALEGGSFDLASVLKAAPASTAPTVAPPRTELGGGQVDRAQVFAWLDGRHFAPAKAAALVRLFIRLHDDRDAALARYFGKRLSSRGARARWARMLPVAAIGRIVRMIRPAGAKALIDGAMVLDAAWRRVAPFGAPRLDAGGLWALLLDLAAEPRGFPEILEGLSAGIGGAEPEQLAKLRAEALRIARDGGHLPVVAALRREGAREVPARRPARSADELPPEEPRPKVEPDYALHVANAGLVLLSPYLPMLFERLGVLGLNEEGKPAIAGLEAQSRAVHLLQYLVDGCLDRPEPALALNKLLCGLPVSTPVEPAIEPAPGDLELCDSLLKAVIGNWPIIKNTSLAGLRETFLQREGMLRHADGRWELRVERKGVDVLVDHIPWSFGVVYHRWMIGPIHVTW